MKVKGVGLKHSLLGIEQIHGKDGLEQVRGAMPERLREMTVNLRQLDWYPIELSAALHAALRDTVGGGKWAESHRISMAAARAELAGPYKIMVRAVQYDTVWDRMERMWSQYYDTGEVKFEEREIGSAMAEFHGVAGFNEGMWGAIAGRIEVLLEMTGARGAAVTVKACGSTQATIEALWLV